MAAEAGIDYADPRCKYEHPLVERYSSKEMSYIWSPHKKFTTWRRLWTALAQAEKELGLSITDEQLAEMRAACDTVDFEAAERYEAQFRHDVMGHVHAFGDAAPAARAIIHLGATSCYVGDNTDLIQMKEAMLLVRRKLVQLMDSLAAFALRYKDLPTLGFTHFQPAQLTTVGKRATLWLQDLVLDLEEVDAFIAFLPLRGVKGTTGTQASFLELFDGDHAKVAALDARVCELVGGPLGFTRSIGVSGQTYTRKIDTRAVSILAGLAQSVYKMCSDLRLLANLKEVEEPFGKNQIGSSAMAYKRNPMRCERCCSLARNLMAAPAAAANTHANQWFERTLDDSAARRLYLPESFLTADVILSTAANVTAGLVVYPSVIRARIMAELPFMATENILMASVKAGGDRQELHEAIRQHSMEAGRRVKQEGQANDLISRVRGDSRFAAVHDTLDSLLDPALFVGRAPQQTEEFIEGEVRPLLTKHRALLEQRNLDEVNV